MQKKTEAWIGLGMV